MEAFKVHERTGYVGYPHEKSPGRELWEIGLLKEEEPLSRQVNFGTFLLLDNSK